MCGILCCMGSTLEPRGLREKMLKLSRRMRHRGPDWSGMHMQHPAGNTQATTILAHERLSIIDPESGAQPLFANQMDVCLSTNGEIYNHEKLRAKFVPDAKFTTASDCEVIAHMYAKMGAQCVQYLDGMFAFVVSCESTGEFIAARDPIGICPLYYGRSGDGAMWFSSEMKSLHDECVSFESFPPGHYYDSKSDEFVAYYKPKFWDLDWCPEPSETPEMPPLEQLREAFEAAVEKRLMSDVPYGVLLSGGLDSSLVASVASRKIAARQAEASDSHDTRVMTTGLHSFSVGLVGSPDLIAAKKVSEFLKTKHHEFTFTIQDGIDALRDVVYHLETYDVTSIRASTPMYLMSRKIKALGVKMVLSGEGADEIFGGYLYFHKAPNREELHKETVRKLQALHLYDCNRANKSTASWGVEARVPFLDQDFMNVAMTLDPAFKIIGGKDWDGQKKIEKWVMRKAFDTKENPYLPEEVLWRQKEQFSDGVGYGWIDGLQDHAAVTVSDQQLKTAKHRFPHNTPGTKEAYLYRTIFEELYPEKPAAETVPGGPSVACSTAIAAEWDASWKGKEDPSGRAVGVHESAYE
ncbi:asparagine synthetase [Sphaeroforma arctica JP610]|uniref:asparagine synthase (glutamine-hydrolyzing) n=1 Tax=Sphaeroforma arctica JP610 TaxID=667725 RepID=A0A0L0GDQ6_9EUKA|nr:asparagine synthetase [Sphaeroforma arctica JP610]KNC86393.1 asparagine synthetase [Sphaeroforma arctica JP610]|eukprot:XP_014160295.1 asparagine synthetase [Sphaeroforma arctica JP610]